MNQYPVYSLVQALDRLSPRTRAKYDSLRGQLADAEAMQRALMERMRSKEERLAQLAHQRDYATGGDSAKLDRELTAARADLDKLELERSRRNAARSNVEQTCSRLDNFIMQRASGADDTATPPWPSNVPGPNAGENLTDAILRLRHEIGIARGELQRIKTAPLPAAEVRAQIATDVDRMASDGIPRVSVDAGRVTVVWPDVMQFAAPSGALSAPSGSASKLLCALFPAELKKLLTAGIVDVKGAIPSADRPQRIREAEARIFALEVGEERLVMAALEAGVEVERRFDASLWAVLCAGAEETVAEAAE